MFKKIFLAVAAAAVLGAAAPAYCGEARPDALAGSPVHSDPVFQDFVETADGYLNPARGLTRAKYLRDAVSSSSFDTGVRVFLRVTPATRGLRKRLAAAGFVFSRERVTVRDGVKRTRLLGWAPAGALRAIRGVKGVAAVREAGDRASKPQARPAI
jgi:hypothetical protein